MPWSVWKGLPTSIEDSSGKRNMEAQQIWQRRIQTQFDCFACYQKWKTGNSSWLSQSRIRWGWTALADAQLTCFVITRFRHRKVYEGVIRRRQADWTISSANRIGYDKGETSSQRVERCHTYSEWKRKSIDYHCSGRWSRIDDRSWQKYGSRRESWWLKVRV